MFSSLIYPSTAQTMDLSLIGLFVSLQKGSIFLLQVLIIQQLVKDSVPNSHISHRDFLILYKSKAFKSCLVKGNFKAFIWSFFFNILLEKDSNLWHTKEAHEVQTETFCIIQRNKCFYLTMWQYQNLWGVLVWGSRERGGLLSHSHSQDPNQ